MQFGEEKENIENKETTNIADIGVNPTENSETKKSQKFEVNTTFTMDKEIYTGSIENYSLDNELGSTSKKIQATTGDGTVQTYTSSTVQVDDGNVINQLKTFYQNNNNNANQTYNHLKDLVNENKNNPEALRQLTASLCKSLSDYYDDTKKYDYVGLNQSEILEKVLNLNDGEKCPALICGTIHGFVMETLHDCGIEAVLVTGLLTSDGKDGGEHATLLYKSDDGNYVWANYGNSSVIEASNIKDAVKTIQSQSPNLRPDGYIRIYDEKSSYSEYSFQEFAFGDEMDKRDYIKDTPFDNTKPVSEPSVQLNTNFSNCGDFSVELGTTFVNNKNNLKSSTTMTIGHTNINNSEIFDKSKSIGLEVEHIREKGNLFFGIDSYLVYGEGTTQTGDTNLESCGSYEYDTTSLGKQMYNDGVNPDDIKSITNSLSQECPVSGVVPIPGSKQTLKYLNAFVKGNIGYGNTLYENDNTKIDNCTQLTAMGGETFNLNGGECGYDARILVEDGVKVSTTSENFATENVVSGGVFLDTRTTMNNHLNVTPGGKLNFATSSYYQAADNLVLSAGAYGYTTITNSAQEWGGGVDISATYKPADSKLSFSALAGFSSQQQKLTVGGFNERTENNRTWYADIAMKINKNTKIYVGYQDTKNMTNSSKNYWSISAGATINF